MWDESKVKEGCVKFDKIDGDGDMIKILKKIFYELRQTNIYSWIFLFTFILVTVAAVRMTSDEFVVKDLTQAVKLIVIFIYLSLIIVWSYYQMNRGN